ncbi:MAG TPA: DNA primase [Dissulfurispiraceae bacterium]|nr:DNA primase [Dissulfurispiraceae bacterium]
MQSDRTIDEIKTKIDIVDLVAEHVDLKRAGQNFKGLCPFHAEKTPSFMVNPSKQICHCFGCGKGGDIFAFTMHYENMNFHEAVSYLASKSGIKIERFTNGPTCGKGTKESIFEIHKEALQFFKNNLSLSNGANAYLKERGLSSEIMETFSIGYSTSMRDPLFSYLKKQSFNPEQIKASGLVYFGENGVHDFFRDRIMFPIFDLQGRPVAFGGRKLSTSVNIPKYLNSPDHILFKKGESCYGINLAKNAITQKGYSIVVEGYLDAIMCHQHSFTNAIAPLGTALTAGHLKKLKRFSSKVLLLFDGDPAGTAATKRSLELIYTEGMSAKIVVLPENDDPDTFLRKHGADYFRQYIGKAVTPVEFLLKLYGRNKLDGVRYALSLIISCPDSLQRDETLRELASWSGIDELTLRQELKNSKRPANHKGSEVDGLQKRTGTISKEEQTLLSIIFSVPEKRHEILTHLDPEYMGSFTMQGLFEKVGSFLSKNKTDNLLSADFMALCSSDEQAVITKLSVDAEVAPEQVDAMIKGCLRTMAMKGIGRQIERAGKAGDEKLLFSLFGKKKLLQKAYGQQ